jgi:hypothetical protein
MNKLFDDYFGLCPVCHRTDGYANAGRSHRFYCTKHKTSWLAGSNLFSDWRRQTEEEQRKLWSDIGLDDFKDVEPFVYPRNLTIEIGWQGKVTPIEVAIERLTDEMIEALLASNDIPSCANFAEVLHWELTQRKGRGVADDSGTLTPSEIAF